MTDWLSLWAKAKVSLKLSTEEFWAATPAQISALSKAEDFQNYRADRRSAIIASTIANVNRGKNKRPYKISDFMPKYEFEKELKSEQTPEEMLGVFAAMVPSINHKNKVLDGR